MQDEAKTGAQIKTHCEEIKRIVKSVADEMKIRQWAVEKATQCGFNTYEIVERMTNFFYDFVTKRD